MAVLFQNRCLLAVNMLKFTIFAVWIGVTLCNGSPTFQKIAGGQQATPTEAPYMVSIKGPPPLNYFLCGGSIVAKRTIVTSGNCLISREPWAVIVTVGSLELNYGGDRYTAKDIIIHPNYHDIILANDIALIILGEDIELSPTVAIIPLFQLEELEVDTVLKATGWGVSEYQGSIQNDLQSLLTKTISYEACDGYYGNMRLSQVCTWNGVGYGQCGGDSGNPLVTLDGELFGVVSWGAMCNQLGPDVYSAIPAYRNWILTNAV